jgi:ABC-type multidrug transport system ATPase subunit
MIELENVVQHYGVRPVLKGINLRINKGELVAVLGPNGMGKSTLLACMAGILQPQHGAVKINGLVRRSNVENEIAIRRMAVYLPDQAFLPGERTGREWLLDVGRLYDIDEERLIEHSQSLLDLFDLAEQADSPIRSYSAGQKKKTALCAALITDAEVLLLDEPFSGGLDPSGLLALKRVLKRLVAEHGCTIVLTSPVAEIVEEVADRVALVEHGKIAAFDTVAGLRSKARGAGSLGKLLEEMLYPETVKKLQRYFSGSQI